jgi:hypothetical protein
MEVSVPGYRLGENLQTLAQSRHAFEFVRGHGSGPVSVGQQNNRHPKERRMSVFVTVPKFFILS